ncbi:MAG: hypothetical protein V7754_08980 [Halioglobus sp.]
MMLVTLRLKALSRFVFLILALLVAGCQASDTTLRESGKGEAYITGFHDGRHSGMKEAGNYLEHMVKDTQRFEETADYRAGWLAGEKEGIKIQKQADAAVAGAAGYKISKDADKALDHDIDKAVKGATKGIDTDSLKVLK